MTSRRKITFWRPAVDALENIVFGLNEPEARFLKTRTRLRQLIEAWKESGPNVEKMLQQNPELARHVQQQWKAFLVPTNLGGAFLAFSPTTQNIALHQGEAAALHIFMNFLIHPRWDRLGGPCARCGIYYLKKTERQKVYCSKTCGRHTTAAAATRKALERSKKAKLQCAEEAIKSWEKGPRQQPWKEFVSERCCLTLKFLTRAVNQQKLYAPDQANSKSVYRLARGARP